MTTRNDENADALVKFLEAVRDILLNESDDDHTADGRYGFSREKIRRVDMNARRAAAKYVDEGLKPHRDGLPLMLLGAAVRAAGAVGGAVSGAIERDDSLAPRARLARALRHEHKGKGAAAAARRDDDVAEALGLTPRARLERETADLWRKGKAA